MRELRKKLFSCFLAVIMVVTVLPVQEIVAPVEVEAANDPDDSVTVGKEIIPDTVLLNALNNIIGNGFTFGDLRKYEGPIDLTPYPNIETVQGLGYARKASSINLSALTKVKVINEKEFMFCEFTTFSLPPYLEEIKAEAFEYCEKLQTIDFPDTLLVIDSGAFNSCKKLDGIVLPEGLVKLGSSAFQNCESLTSVVIPDGMNASTENAGQDINNGIGAQVFMGCTSLTSIKLGKGMTAIPSSFLQGTTSLLTIEIPEKIAEIRDSAFLGSGLVAIDISKNTQMTSINNSVFASCEQLAIAKLPSTITTIGEGAFSSCSVLTDANIISHMKSLTKIGNNAFNNSALLGIVIPENVTTIGDMAFRDCPLLMKVEIKDYSSEPKSDTVKSLGAYAFSGCGRLTEVVLPTKYENNVLATIEIGTSCFESCVALKYINFPINITKIGNYAFRRCAYTVTKKSEIKYETFTPYYILPSQISKEYSNGAVSYMCFSSEIVGYDHYDRYYIKGDLYLSPEQINGGKVVYINKYSYTEELNNRLLTESDIGIKEELVRTGLEYVDLSKNNNIQLGIGVFAECFYLKDVYLPDTIKEIPDETFSGCGIELRDKGANAIKLGLSTSPNVEWYFGLKNVQMSNGVTKIGDEAFKGCYKFELSDNLPGKLVHIGNEAFSNCESLGEITLPKTLEHIGDKAFQQCARTVDHQLVRTYGLQKVTLDQAASLKYVGQLAFDESAIERFIMDDSAPLQIINTGTFRNCQFLKEIRFGSSVEYIGDAALAKCGVLTSVSVPDICTFESTACDYEGSSITNIINNDLGTFYYVIERNGTDFTYVGTQIFSITIRALNENVSARVNKDTILPLMTPAMSTNNHISSIEIGNNQSGYKYSFDENNKLTSTVPSDALLLPSIKEYTHVIPKTELTKEIKVDTWAVNLWGYEEAQDVPLAVQLNMKFARHGDNTSTTLYVSPTIHYTLDITQNPCTEIVTEDRYVISAAKSSATTIAPKFIPMYDDSLTTDIISWEVLTGGDLIELTSDENDFNRTASIKLKKTGVFGTCSVRIKAGSVEKVIYIYISAPSKSITMDKSKVDIMLSTTDVITATINYDAAYTEASQLNPDYLTFTSADPEIAEVVSVEVISGVTYCTLRGKKSGTTTITAKSQAGGSTAKCTVSVATGNLKLSLTDSDGNDVNNNDSVYVVGKTGKSFIYSINETLGNNNVVATSSNEAVAKVSVSKTTKKLTVTGLKKGKATIQIYPEVGNATNNGVTFNVSIDGDITSITLKTQKLQLGVKATVFTGMKNVFGQEIKVANAANFASITDNKIEFTSSDPSTVTVDAYGNVKVVKINDVAANVTITCTASRDGIVTRSAKATITPVKPDVKTVTYSGATSVKEGETTTIKIGYSPSNAKYKTFRVTPASGYISYASYKWDVKTMTLKVTGKKAGTVTFTVNITTDSGTISKAIKVNITKPVTLKKVSQKKPKAGKKKITVQWKKVSGASGYQIAMSTKKKSGYKNIKTVKGGSKVKYTKKKLKRKKKYYFKVRAYVKTSKGKEYGPWSKVKYTKAK